MTEGPTNLTPIDGGQTPDEIAEAVRQMKKTLPHLIEYQAIVAKLHRASYEAHIEAGFSADQALILCKGKFG